MKVVYLKKNNFSLKQEKKAVQGCFLGKLDFTLCH